MPINTGVRVPNIVRNGDATSFIIPSSPNDFSVIANGLKCDGVTDDTAALSALLTSIGSTPTQISMPSGGKCLLSSITIPVNISLNFGLGGGIQVVTGQTVIIVGPIHAHRQQIFFNSLASQGSISFAGNRTMDRFCPEWWGAVKNGVANDLAALQACTEAADTAGGGTIDLGRGNYNIGNGTWKIANANLQHHLNIVGQNPLSTQITSSATGTTAAIYVNKQKYVYISSIYLFHAGGIDGVGMVIGGDNGGTQSNGNILSEIIIDSFITGIGTSGSPGVGTSSELTFINLQLQNCTTGFNNASFNGLDYTFIQLQMSNCTTGINMSTAGCNVFGGSASFNGTDFRFANGGENTIQGFRTESANLFVDFSASNLSINSCIVEGFATPEAHTAIKFNNSQLTITDSLIKGQILVFNAISLILRNNFIVDPLNTFTSTSNPNGMGPGFRIDPTGSGCRFESVGNMQISADGTQLLQVWPTGSGYCLSPDGAVPRKAVYTTPVGQGAALVITANAIQPSSYIHHVGAGLIKNITSEDAYHSPFQGTCVQLIPDAAFAYDNTGNIAGSGTAVIGRLMTACFDRAAGKWYMSY